MRRITERRQATLAHLAYHDTLTGLPNRQLFLDRLGQAIASAARNRRRLAVFYIDLDRFKVVNDSLGHTIGDLLLQQIAERFPLGHPQAGHRRSPERRRVRRGADRDGVV